MNRITHKNITRIKNITNKKGHSAYLEIESKIFPLHYPDRYKSKVLETDTNELIALYQRIGENKSIRYFTHLVRPVDKKMVYRNTDNYRYGRMVELVAYTGIENKFSLEDTLIAKTKFRNSFGYDLKIEKIAKTEDIEEYQKDLWDRFVLHFFHGLEPEITVENQEDIAQLEVEEGERKLVEHLRWETSRNNNIIQEKKRIASQDNNLKCEVCHFSFIDTYGQEYIECHHILPIHQGKRLTRIEDLALVCSNCHRMLHRKINGRYLSIVELKKVVNNM